MEWSIFNHLYYSKKANAYLLYSSLSNMIVELNKNGYDEILKIKKDPDRINFKNELYRFLFDGSYIVDSNETEINKILLATLNQRFDPRSLSLTIAPTRACNFACPYCYEKDRASVRMTEKIQEGILEFVKKHKMIKSLFITWYGGEPTLSISTIKYLSTKMQKMVDNYSAMIITNGYRLDKLVPSIEDLRISKIQVTIDGTKKTHDQTRRLLNGAGTFDKIMSNLDFLLSKCNNIQVSIRMNITTENSSQYAVLYKLLQKRYGKRVHLYPAFVHDYGGYCQAGTCFDDGLEKARFLKKLFDEEGVYTKDIYPFRTNKGCMSQKLNAYVIGPQGELYKCWHHLGMKDKEIGDIFTHGTIRNAGLWADLMLKKDVIFDNRCKACILFPSCDGGCVDMKNKNEKICIPARSMLEDFIDIRYTVKTAHSINYPSKSE